MNRFFIYLFVSKKACYNFLLGSNIIFLTFLFIYSPNSYGQSLTAEQIYKKVSGAVVVVYAYDDNDKLASQGSGVVLNDKGYVVTNYHVLSGNNRLEILHGKEIVPYVDIIGIDVEKDILILKIEAKKFPAIKISDSKSLNIGQRVYAIGSPMGLENSISEGIISGLRSVDELKRNFIQMTASISHGSSGGAVVNDQGELIGISTLTAKEGQNLNFAIPIGDVLKVEIGSYSQNNEYKDFELVEKGKNYFNSGEYREAIKYYSRFIEMHPDEPIAYFNRGISKRKLEDFAGAIEDYNKAIQLNPNFADAYTNRGVAKHYLMDYQSAIQDYNKVIEISPNDSIAFYNRGTAKSYIQDFMGAIKDFNRAIEINPKYSSAFINRGVAKSNLEDYAGAIRDYNMAMGINPNDADTYYFHGVAMFNLNDYKYAIQDYDKAIEINPNYSKAYNSRGNAERGLKDFLDAVQDYDKAIEINPNFADAFINRGVVKRNLEDYSGAIRDYNKAIEIDSNNPNAYYDRGIVRYYLKDYQTAIEDYDRAIQINSKFADAYNNRGLAKYYFGDKNGACIDWSKAGELGSASAFDFIKKYCMKN